METNKEEIADEAAVRDEEYDEAVEADEEYEIVTAEEVEDANEEGLARKLREQEKRMEEALERLEEEGVKGLGEEDLKEIVLELRHLEEKLHMWKEVQRLKITQLKQIFSRLDKIQ